MTKELKMAMLLSMAQVIEHIAPDEYILNQWHTTALPEVLYGELISDIASDDTQFNNVCTVFSNLVLDLL